MNLNNQTYVCVINTKSNLLHSNIPPKSVMEIMKNTKLWYNKLELLLNGMFYSLVDDCFIMAKERASGRLDLRRKMPSEAKEKKKK